MPPWPPGQGEQGEREGRQGRHTSRCRACWVRPPTGGRDPAHGTARASCPPLKADRLAGLRPPQRREDTFRCPNGWGRGEGEGRSPSPSEACL